MPISRKFFPEGGGPKDIEFFQMGGGGGFRSIFWYFYYMNIRKLNFLMGRV